MASDRDDSLYGKVHERLHKHLHKHIAKHINFVHRSMYRVNRLHAHVKHIGIHLGELIVVGIFAFFSLMHAGNSGSLPNNTSFGYPLKQVSTLECRTQYFEDMDESCKINLPIIRGANYAAYMHNTTYRSIYTTLRAAPYSDTWNQEIGAHAGIDIATARGTPLYSIGNGVVYSAGWNSSYGNLVRIKYIYNGEIVYGVYAHMDTIEVEVGQVVTRGQKIGTVGNTGNTSGALGGYHVHFEIDKDNGGRPAYSYTNCADLDKGHYKIIQNGLCRNELFKYQYDPIKILEGIPKSEADKPTIYSTVNDNNENTQTNTGNQTTVVENTGNVTPSNTEHSSAENTGKVENNVNTGNNTSTNNTPINTENNNSNNTSNNENNKPQETVKPTEETKPTESVNNSTGTNEQTQTPEENKVEEPQPTQPAQEQQVQPIQPENNKPQETETPAQNNEPKPVESKDPEVLKLDFSKLTGMPQHFMTQRDVEMKSKLNTRSLRLGETVTLDIEVFKKGTSENREYYSNGILQVPFDFITNNDNISVNITSLQLLTKGKAKVEITGNKEGKSALVIKLGGEKIGVLNIEVK